MFGKKIEPKKINVDAKDDYLVFEYKITDRKQSELAAGKLSLHKELYSGWSITSIGKDVILSFKTEGSVSVESVAEKFEKMVS